MESDLEILILHLQKEVDCLRMSMDNCAAEWNFEGAKLYRDALYLAKEKLTVLKNIHNPNCKNIDELKEVISRMETSMDNPMFSHSFHDKATRDLMKEALSKRIKEKICKYKEQLAKLQEVSIEQRIDNDKLLEILEQLQTREINHAELEVVEESAFLKLSVLGRLLQFEIVFNNETCIDDHVYSSAMPILRKIGFNLETLIMVVDDFDVKDNMYVLKIIARITYDVFRRYGNKEMNVRVW